MEGRMDGGLTIQGAKVAVTPEQMHLRGPKATLK